MTGQREGIESFIVNFELPPNLRSSLGAASRFCALCLRMATCSRDRNLKPFYSQFLIGRHVAVINQNVCCLLCCLGCLISLAFLTRLATRLGILFLAGMMGVVPVLLFQRRRRLSFPSYCLGICNLALISSSGEENSALLLISTLSRFPDCICKLVTACKMVQKKSWTDLVLFSELLSGPPCWSE